MHLYAASSLLAAHGAFYAAAGQTCSCTPEGPELSAYAPDNMKSCTSASSAALTISRSVSFH